MDLSVVAPLVINTAVLPTLRKEAVLIHGRCLVTNATASVAQTIFSGIVLFVLYRYLIANLGVEQLGLWSVILASTSAARLSDLGLTGSVVKFVARYRALNDDSQTAEIVQTATITIAATMAIIILLMYLILDVLLELVIPPESMTQAMIILPWAMLSLWLAESVEYFNPRLTDVSEWIFVTL